jgi:hypothetical protein
MPDINFGPSDEKIVEVAPGNYSPGAESALTILVNLINASWKWGIRAAADYQARLESITDPDTGWLSEARAPQVSAGAIGDQDVVEPPVDIPATASAADVMDLFETKYLELFELLKQAFVDFRAEYFPDEQAAYLAAEDFLRASLANPETALPPGVAEQLLVDARDRVLNDASRAQDAVLAEFASRRFPLPPGAAASAVLRIQQQAQDKVAEAARAIVVASVEQMRFAVTATLQLRATAMDAAVKYIAALASGPDLASRAVGIGYDAQAKLISAAASFYNSRLGVAELKSRIEQFNATNSLDAAKANQAAELALIEARLKALLAECQALAQMATSLFNNLQASARSGYDVNGTTSNN